MGKTNPAPPNSSFNNNESTTTTGGIKLDMNFSKPTRKTLKTNPQM